MNHGFQLVGIDHAPFEALFGLSDEQLKACNAERRIATQSPGFPCRVSLEDACEGEELLLLPYLHQPANSPYRASGPIFVRRGARQRRLAPGEVPTYVTQRLISVRAYDAGHMMVAASVCEGSQVAQEIPTQFRNDEVAYIHLHNAKRGCFSCQVLRA
ncbi:MAG TPA: DUF1203 domain-containing protein [Xanthomonadaceae bacterium]|nr:DUF1203 domain-containing protein [Xanthomonadaceae bacterium]